MKYAILSLFLLVQVESTGEKAFGACKKFGESMLECQNILRPHSRVRVPIDLLLFPHMVLIGFQQNISDPLWKCGGSLISPDWVLTAAHCKEDVSGPADRLLVGTATFEFSEADELSQERKVSNIIVHPEYKPPSKYHDLALIKADKPFELNRDVRIACLNTNHDIASVNLTVIGFGTTLSGAAEGSDTLMAVNVDLIDSAKCNQSMKPLIKRKMLSKGIIEEQICAGDYQNGGRDTCQGDSGGPLQFLPSDVDCKARFPLHILVGVTSFGRDCGRKMSPGIYTRVSKYIDWIEGIVWP